jgi:hypothetical protein
VVKQRPCFDQNVIGGHERFTGFTYGYKRRVPQNVLQVLEDTGKADFDPHRPYQKCC